MRIMSICVAPVSPLWGIDHPDHAVVNSAIKKQLVSSLDSPKPILVQKVGLEGDEQADFSVHGGLNKAIYAYPSEHYSFWNEFLQTSAPQQTPIKAGFVGENLSVEGFLEDCVWIGDIWQLGEVELQVTQLREPCFKLNARMRHKGASKAMTQSGRCGWYLQVNQGGLIQAGQAVLVTPGRREISIKMQNDFLLKKNRQNELPL